MTWQGRRKLGMILSRARGGIQERGFVKFGTQGAFLHAQRLKEALVFYPKAQGPILAQAGLPPTKNSTLTFTLLPI